MVYKVSFSWPVRISNFLRSKLSLPMEPQRKVEAGLLSGQTRIPWAHTARVMEPGWSSFLLARSRKTCALIGSVIWHASRMYWSSASALVNPVNKIK